MSRWPDATAPTCPVCLTNKLRERGSRSCLLCYHSPGWQLPKTGRAMPTLGIPAPVVTPSGPVEEPGTAPDVQPYRSRFDGSYVFGAISDTHLCSKYCRLDCLTDLYRRFAEAGADRVFHAGNWIDGEDDRKNKYDLLVRGMDGQIDYLTQEYPLVPGLVTYAVAGNDHEGWYGQREGINIGRYRQMQMERSGRRDWAHLGHMEAFVPLEHAKTGTRTMLHIMHPGGGSAYAVSYTMQKIVEGYEGGEKPAVLLAGHYHKLEHLVTRNVVQTGCTQDLTPWARGKKLRYEVGGTLVRLKQDAETGALISSSVEIFSYFNKGWYSGERWSHSGPVVQPEKVGLGCAG
jgi:predicted phosphodiesterase